MGDFLPISTFFYEIWIKNRPFLQLFTKQVICHNLALHPIPIGIMHYAIGGNHRKMNRLTMRNGSTKAGELVTKNCIVILIYHKLILRELHLADIDRIIGSLYQHINLCSCTINRIIFHLPGIRIGNNTRDAKRLLDLRNMLETYPLESQAAPRIPKRRRIIVRPERRIIGFVLLHELQEEQREIVHQAIDGIIFPGAIGIGTDKKQLV